MRFSRFITLVVSIIVLMIVNMLIGSVRIPVADVCRILLGDDTNEIWTNIILQSRLPQALTAIVAGAGLAVSGLQMQTVFRNPLAGPSVLGISNGSALGVAFVVLLSGRIGGVALSRLGYLGDTAMSVAAIVGALAVMLLILWVSQKVKGNVTLLIIGVMIGYLANAIIGVLKFLSPEEDVKAFVVWGLGSFSRVSGELDKNADPIKAFIDTFPAGTLSGAPKVRAMQLISEYEPHNRGAYGGCIGIIGLDGSLNQAITIRTFVSRNGELWFQAGGGIVAKSNEEYELQEVNNKLGALRRAILMAEEM